VDAKRVYMAGISNGGMMAERMACEHAGSVAAIAVVAGSISEKMAVSCKQSQAVPILLIHGTEDPVVPWSGGAVAGFEEFGRVLSAKDSARFWAARNLCSETPRILKEPDNNPQDGTRVQTEIFAGCSNNSEVRLVMVEGGGHTWPGGYQYLPERFIGKTSKDIDANKIIWEFFQRWREKI
jgi:polyhydroxybutyrate depolymerase